MEILFYLFLRFGLGKQASSTFELSLTVRSHLVAGHFCINNLCPTSGLRTVKRMSDQMQTEQVNVQDKVLLISLTGEIKSHALAFSHSQDFLFI